MKKILLAIFVAMSSCEHDLVDTQTDVLTEYPVSVVYDEENMYSAFCDLVFINNVYYAVFRIGENHAPYHDYHSNGYLKILSSRDFVNWTEELILRDDNWDLRDPCFCYTEKNDELLLYYGKYSFATPNPDIKNGVYRLSVKDKIKVIEEKQVNIGEYSSYWLWKTYKVDDGYIGVAYEEDNYGVLVKSIDGINYDIHSAIPIKCSETSLVFKNKKIYAFIRNVISQSYSYVAISDSAYSKWSIHELSYMIESPESFKVDEDIFISGRSSFGVSIFRFDEQKKDVKPVFNYFSLGGWGDAGYPGVVVNDNYINTVYYAKSKNLSYTIILGSRIEKSKLKYGY